MMRNVKSLVEQLKYGKLTAHTKGVANKFFDGKLVDDYGITIVRCRCNQDVDRGQELVAIKYHEMTSESPYFVEVVASNKPTEEKIVKYI